jgi:signal transduction histidine kinase
MMPEMDGYEVCRRLKADERTREIPVIFLSALNDTSDKLNAFKAGGVDYVTKPFQAEEVLARVTTHLELQHARKALKAQNQELLEMARLREDVERMSRHDLKTPLNTVIAYTQTVMLNDHLTKQERDDLKMIESAGYRMLRMINMSLDLVKMERGLYQLQPVPVNIVQVLSKVTLEAYPHIQQKNLTVRILLDGRPVSKQDAWYVQGEELLCYSMLANLLSNAVNASPEGGLLTIRLAGEETATISIHNAGRVPEAIHEKFFEKYVTARNDSQGTGLGTYSAKLMAEIQHGDIGMTSSDQEGTTLTIHLPGSHAPSPEQPSNASDAIPGAFFEPPVSPDNDLLVAESLKALSEDVLTALQGAVTILDVDETLRIIQKISQQNASVGEKLQTLVNEYQFDTLQALCDGAMR